MSAVLGDPDLSEVPTADLGAAVAGMHACHEDGSYHCSACIAVESELFARMKFHVRQALLAAEAKWDASYATEYVAGESDRMADEMWPGRNAWRQRLKPPKKAIISRRLAKEIMERDAYRCRICLTWKDLSVDHIYPEVLGGASDPDNLQTLCRPCNSRKGVKVE